MLTTVTYITEVDGQERSREVQLASAECLIEIDTDGDGAVDEPLGRPAVTQNIEIENDGDTATPEDQCGNVERFRTTNNGWAIRIEGIVTVEDREDNLTLADLRDIVAPADSVFIRTDLINGQFAVQNTLITQASDLVSVNTLDTDGDEKAFEFQLQLGESSSE